MSETISIIVWCWHDPQKDALLLRAVYANTAEAVQLRDGSFLLRISLDEQTSIQRCYIRHIASGRDAYVQGGPNLRAFVKACLLNSGNSEESTSPEAPV